MTPLKEKYKKLLPDLKKTLGVKNDLAVPKIIKVVVNTSFGSTKDKAKIELIPDRLAKITGQKPVSRLAKKSIAGFKSREGDIVGQMVTLRGSRMYEFLDKLINVAIPRQRDFRGLDQKSVDEMGNLTIGIREHTVFPETSDEDLKNVFGFSITVVTSAKSRDQALVLLRALGFPFKK